MVQAGSRWPVTAKASIHSQASLCGIFGVQMALRPDLLQVLGCPMSVSFDKCCTRINCSIIDAM